MGQSGARLQPGSAVTNKTGGGSLSERVDAALTQTSTFDEEVEDR